MVHSPLNLTVVSLYRSPSGNFDIFLKKLEDILNSLSVYPLNLIIAGDFNVNFMTDSTKRNHLPFLLKTYNLEYIVTFPTRVVTQLVSVIDNIFLDRSKYDKFIIEPSYNRLSDQDALSLTLYTHSCKVLKSIETRIGRKYHMESISNFKRNLSFESWESVFDTTNGNEVNAIFSNFLNVYLRIFYCSFPQHKSIIRNKGKGWITIGIITSCRRKKELYLLYRVSNNTALKNYYRKYCKILAKTIQLAKRLYYNKLKKQSKNKTKTA